MKLTVNGDPHEVRSATLDALLVELGYGGRVVATAVNEDFVPRAARAARAITPGDRVEIVAPTQGG
jgi:sulfur carrier protein